MIVICFFNAHTVNGTNLQRKLDLIELDAKHLAAAELVNLTIVHFWISYSSANHVDKNHTINARMAALHMSVGHQQLNFGFIIFEQRDKIVYRLVSIGVNELQCGQTICFGARCVITQQEKNARAQFKVHQSKFCLQV